MIGVECFLDLNQGIITSDMTNICPENNSSLQSIQARQILMNKIQGWWRTAANDDYFQVAYRLTEFGLGD